MTLAMAPKGECGKMRGTPAGPPAGDIPDPRWTPAGGIPDPRRTLPGSFSARFPDAAGFPQGFCQSGSVVDESGSGTVSVVSSRGRGGGRLPAGRPRGARAHRPTLGAACVEGRPRRRRVERVELAGVGERRARRACRARQRPASGPWGLALGERRDARHHFADGAATAANQLLQLAQETATAVATTALAATMARIV